MCQARRIQSLPLRAYGPTCLYLHGLGTGCAAWGPAPRKVQESLTVTLPPRRHPSHADSGISHPSKSQINSPPWLPEMPHPCLCFCFPEPHPPYSHLMLAGPLVPEAFSVDVTCLFCSPCAVLTIALSFPHLISQSGPLASILLPKTPASQPQRPLHLLPLAVASDCKAILFVGLLASVRRVSQD